MSEEENIRIMLTGDVMLGRLVKNSILLNGTEYPLGRIRPLMRQSDLVIANLECAISNYPYVWSRTEKAFYFEAPPEAVKILSDCGIQVVNLANNHILDYDIEGLLDTLSYLKDAKIAYVGAGKNLSEARAPTYFQVKGQRFGIVAFCDHQRDFAAESNKPGMAYINFNNEEEALQIFATSLNEMKKLRTDWPILSLHWGPNMVNEPSKAFIRLAHAIIDMGYKLLFGHSAHVFHGIEIYKGFPIFYATGDLVDDYYVSPEFKNDHQLLFELNISQNKVKNIILYPIFIQHGQALPANEKQFDYIAHRMSRLCEAFGTAVKKEREVLILENCL